MSIISYFNHKLSFRVKSVLASIVVSGIVTLIVLYVLLSSLRVEIIDHAKSRAENHSKEVQGKVENFIGELNVLLQQISGNIGGSDEFMSGQRDFEMESYFRKVKIDHPEITGITIYFDDAMAYSQDSLKSFHYVFQGGQLNVQERMVGKMDLPAEHVHFRTIYRKQEAISEVFLSNVIDENLPTLTLAQPVYSQGSLLGSVTADVSLHPLMPALNTEYIVSENGVIVLHADPRKTAKPISKDVIPADQFEMFDNNPIQETHSEVNLTDYEVNRINSFEVINSGNYWRMYSSYSFSDAYTNFKSKINVIGLLVFVALGMLTYAIFYLNTQITRTLTSAVGIIKNLAKGEIQMSQLQDMDHSSKEGEKMIEGLTILSERINEKTAFTQNLIEGKLDSQFQVEDDDKLGNALLQLRQSLKDSKEEAQKRQWTNQGLAQFSDILRGNTDDFEELTAEIISSLVKYLNANQGAMYLLQENEEGENKLKLSGVFAYERRKFIEGEFDADEGLVGQCIKEKQSIHLTEIPKEYIRITSGLGKAVPKALLLVPLKIEEEVNGVIEIAGFHPFEDYQISFVEKLAESIALTLHNAKNNQVTKSLLEKSQIQSEELRAAEEEMRQNMEELQATQEELNRRAGETEKLLKETEQMNEFSQIQIEISNELNRQTSLNDFLKKILEEVSNHMSFDFSHAFIIDRSGDEPRVKSSGIFECKEGAEMQPMINATRGIDVPLGEGLAAVAIEHEQTLYFGELQDETDFHRREQAIQTGLKSGYIMPLYRDNEPACILEFYKTSVDENFEMLYEFSIQLSSVFNEQLSRIFLIEESAQQQIELHAKQDDAKAIMDGLDIAMAVIENSGVVEDCNRAFLDLCGLEDASGAEINLFEKLEGGVVDFTSGDTHEVTIVSGDKKTKCSIRSKLIQKQAGHRRLLQFSNVES